MTALCRVQGRGNMRCIRERGHLNRHRYGHPSPPSTEDLAYNAAHTLPLTLRAGELNADHIGHTIELAVTLGQHAQVPAVVTAELRQIYHMYGETTVSVTGPDSTGDLEEFQVSPNLKVTIS